MKPSFATCPAIYSSTCRRVLSPTERTASMRLKPENGHRALRKASWKRPFGPPRHEHRRYVGLRAECQLELAVLPMVFQQPQTVVLPERLEAVEHHWLRNLAAYSPIRSRYTGATPQTSGCLRGTAAAMPWIGYLRIEPMDGHFT